MAFNILIKAISPSFSDIVGSFCEDPSFSSDGRWMFVRTDAGVLFQFNVTSYTSQYMNGSSSDDVPSSTRGMLEEMENLEPQCCYDCGGRIVSYNILDVCVCVVLFRFMCL